MGNIYYQFLDNNEYAEKSYEDPYGAIYHLNLYDYLKYVAPDIISRFDEYITSHKLAGGYDTGNLAIYLATESEYSKFDENFANELSFLSYINSETAEMDRHRDITEYILTNENFENVIQNLSEWRKDTSEVDGDNYIIIDMCKGITNNGAAWGVHIDNKFGESIGSADITTVWQFNMLMKILGSKYIL